MARAAVLYGVALVLLTVYGVEVCPFLESLTAMELVGTLALSLAVAWGVRLWCARTWLEQAQPFERARRRFWLELGSLLGAGGVAGLVTVGFWSFPPGSAGKLLVGFVVLAVFSAADMAMDEEYRVVTDSRDSATTVPVHFGSIARRFMWGALATVILVALVVALILVRDLEWLASVDESRLGDAKMLVVVEVAFLAVALCGYVGLLVSSFARNLQAFLEMELSVMREVSSGRYERRVPISSQDEFGRMASYTNLMIEGLAERDRIREVFGKMVSPLLSKRLLEGSQDGLRREGSRRKLAILFSDVRSFTTRTESSEPEQVVGDLNLYFGQMVEVVHAHGGVVDKFIGDGMMAFFGLVDEDTAAQRAVAAAMEMQKALEGLQDQLSAPMQMGIGVHVGEVVAGAIGAPSRLEFTIIGDPVNVAARLESQTKELGVGVLISQQVYERLEPSTRDGGWKSLGQRALKGKRSSVEVYGI